MLSRTALRLLTPTRRKKGTWSSRGTGDDRTRHFDLPVRLGRVDWHGAPSTEPRGPHTNEDHAHAATVEGSAPHLRIGRTGGPVRCSRCRGVLTQGLTVSPLQTVSVRMGWVAGWVAERGTEERRVRRLERLTTALRIAGRTHTGGSG